jgi:hypothetical protein
MFKLYNNNKPAIFGKLLASQIAKVPLALARVDASSYCDEAHKSVGDSDSHFSAGEKLS